MQNERLQVTHKEFATSKKLLRTLSPDIDREDKNEERDSILSHEDIKVRNELIRLNRLL